VLFRDQRPGPLGATADAAGHIDAATDARLSHLLNELAETKAYLNNLLEKEQAAHEQLKSASEELLSSNEEMLNTNQELQTAKEEAQAANEELHTLNEEMRRRHLELSQVYDDLANTVSSGQVALIMISNDLKCRMLTPAAEKILKLKSSAVGLPVSQLMSQFKRPELEGVVRDVIEALHSCELEISDSDQRYYDLRIRPYLTGTKMVNGAVLVLVDITAQKKTIKSLENSQAYTTDLLNSVPVKLLILDADLRVVMANQKFLDKFKVSSGQVKHALIYDLVDGMFNVPGLKLLLESTLPQQCLVDQFVMERQIPGLGRQVLKLNARYLIKHDDNPARILLAIVDMTEAGSVY
jgi:two-component system CheB/CheR fusion protein